MNARALRRLTTITVLALTSVATVAACSSAGPSRPDQMPSTTPSTTPSTAPSTEAASTPTPPTADPTRPATGPPCLGAVIYTLNASDTGKPWPNLCITVGGVLLVKNLGPEGFSLSPADKVDCWYEAAVRDCRLIHTGTVKVTIINAHQTRQLTLVIADASSPPLPSPACLRAGTVRTADANDGGPPWMAMCMKLGAVLRFENLGPGRLSANPQSAVSTRYEAGVHTVRFVKAATVTFTVTAPHETRSLIVVAVK